MSVSQFLVTVEFGKQRRGGKPGTHVHLLTHAARTTAKTQVEAVHEDSVSVATYVVGDGGDAVLGELQRRCAGMPAGGVRRDGLHPGGWWHHWRRRWWRRRGWRRRRWRGKRNAD